MQQETERRYADAYILARMVTRFGTLIQYGGLIAGSLIGTASAASVPAVLSMLRRPIEDSAVITVAAGAVFGIAFGVVTGAVLYLAGTLAAAHGQLLLASLDTAVNTSRSLPSGEWAPVPMARPHSHIPVRADGVTMATA